jgi:hypothetical protein
MAFDTFDNRNKITAVPLYFTYSLEHDADQYKYSQFSLGMGPLAWWKISRRARKTYSYVGLTASAAQRCAAEKARQYTRPFAHWCWSAGEWSLRYQGKAANRRNLLWQQADKYFESVANINVTHSGPVYEVQITVDEEIIIYELMHAPKKLPSDKELAYLFNSAYKTGLSMPGIFTYDE